MRRRQRDVRRRSFDALSRCWRVQAAAVGDRRSSAHASRWRSIGTCASQQSTEQNASGARTRLQVDTLQAQYMASKGNGFLHVEHGFQKVRASPAPGVSTREVERHGVAHVKRDRVVAVPGTRG